MISETAEWDGEHCQACGEGYDTVYWLPDEWWALITPKPEQSGAGLLCPDCALVRLVRVAVGIENARVMDEWDGGRRLARRHLLLAESQDAESGSQGGSDV